MDRRRAALTLILNPMPTTGQGMVQDWALSDDGVLYTTLDRGAHWRCLGIVDTDDFLFGFGAVDDLDWRHGPLASTPGADLHGRPA